MSSPIPISSVVLVLALWASLLPSVDARECPLTSLPRLDASQRRLMACVPVEVDHVKFCLESDLELPCSGPADKPPRGTACPNARQKSISGCRKTSTTYDVALASCFAHPKTTCQKQKSGNWGCSAPAPVNVPVAVTKPSRHIRIVAYNDVYRLEQLVEDGIGSGGISRFAEYVAKVRREDPNTLVLFGGDTLSPSLLSTIFKGLHMIDGHNQLGLDYSCIGNHEFDFKLKGFYRAVEQSNFPWLNANAYDVKTGQLLTNTIPHAIEQVNGVAVGLFGVMLDMNDTSMGVRFTDPMEAAREQVAILKEKGAEFIIALTHQDAEDDTRLANEVEGLDLVLGGHDHEAMIQLSTQAPMVKAEMDFKAIWDIKVNFANKQEKPKLHFNNVHIEQTMPTNVGMEALIEKYMSQVDEKYKQVVAYSFVKLDLSESVVRRRESALGNYFTDVMRENCGRPTDIAWINGGALRGDRRWPSGNITLGDVFEWFPFPDTLVKMKVTGKSLHKLIQKMNHRSCGVDGKAQLNNVLLHPSGFSYQYKCTGHNKGVVKDLKLLKPGNPDIHGDMLLTMTATSYLTEFLEDDASVEIIENTSDMIRQCVVDQMNADLCIVPGIQNRFKVMGKR